MVALCQAVEVLLGGVTFQAAAYPEYLDGGEALLETAAQGLVHCLGIVHLAVAYRTFDAAETQSVGADLSVKVLGGDEIDALYMMSRPVTVLGSVCSPVSFSFGANEPMGVSTR